MNVLKSLIILITSTFLMTTPSFSKGSEEELQKEIESLKRKLKLKREITSLKSEKKINIKKGLSVFIGDVEFDPMPSFTLKTNSFKFDFLPYHKIYYTKGTTKVDYSLSEISLKYMIKKSNIFDVYLGLYYKFKIGGDYYDSYSNFALTSGFIKEIFDNMYIEAGIKVFSNFSSKRKSEEDTVKVNRILNNGYFAVGFIF